MTEVSSVAEWLSIGKGAQCAVVLLTLFKSGHRRSGEKQDFALSALPADPIRSAAAASA